LIHVVGEKGFQRRHIFPLGLHWIHGVG